MNAVVHQIHIISAYNILNVALLKPQTICALAVNTYEFMALTPL